VEELKLADSHTWMQ